MPATTLAIGMRCVGRSPPTVWRTIASLRRAGLLVGAGTPLHFFVDGPFAELERLAGHGRLTWHGQPVGGWPNFLLAATELHLREPDAAHYLLVEDDVVFCRDIGAYLDLQRSGLDVASLYTSAQVEQRIRGRGAGFTRLNPGWHVSSGALALLFSNARLEQFLASDFVRGYRRRPPTDLDPRHFRRDGLHHTDCVVGRFAAEAGCGIQYHWPSLAQHIGQASYMYPGFNGKGANRFSGDFPGEDASALTLD
ncbi:MAG: hypothetical protein ACM3ST_13985 [Bdellovibrio bacteriovorus]